MTAGDKYEYKVFTFSSSSNIAEYADFYNEVGSKGWMLVKSMGDNPDGSNRSRALFMRKLTGYEL